VSAVAKSSTEMYKRRSIPPKEVPRHYGKCNRLRLLSSQTSAGACVCSRQSADGHAYSSLVEYTTTLPPGQTGLLPMQV
jgi:hypothetical protein